ncbi:unnamed protein product [Pipistrellus nathusii]|uniref:Beta-defensin n=1 Tax=Pipistrellus nathusii TaxID=59473 RepID=A0ABP0ACE2_PIPNA
MKLLLLTLTVLVFLPRVTPELGAKKCLKQAGHCKKSCDANEEIKPGCKSQSGRVCCVRKHKGKDDLDIHMVPRTSPLPEYAVFNTHPMDYIVTGPPHTPVYYYSDTEDELSDQVVS